MSLLGSGGGFFGSGGKNDSGNTTNETQSIVSNLDFQDSGDGANALVLGSVAESEVTINTSDFGAIDAASDIANQAFEFANSANQESQSTLGNAVNTAKSALQSAVEVAKSATQDEGARTTQLLILSVLGLGIGIAYLRRKKAA